MLLINAAKRAGILPDNSATQLIAPLAEVAAILFIIGLVIDAGPRAGRAGVITLFAAVAGLAPTVGVEFVINLVLSQLSSSRISELRGQVRD